jgi:oleandomycin transport system ATP-binding protein
VADYDVTRQAHQVRQLIGLTGQYAPVDETLTGAENLILIGRLVGEDRKTRTSRGPSIATCTRSILPAPAPSGAVIGGQRFPTVRDTPDRGPAEW